MEDGLIWTVVGQPDVHPPIEEEDLTVLMSHQPPRTEEPIAIMQSPDIAMQHTPDPMEVEQDDHEEDDIPDEPESSIDSDGERHWQAVELHAIGQRYQRERVRWDDYEVLVRHCCHIYGWPRRRLSCIHEVAYTPVDLRNSDTVPLLLQQYDDILPGSIHQLVLLDVEYYALHPSTTVKTIRSAWLLPKQLHRSGLVFAVGLHNYCEFAANRRPSVAVACIVWKNGELWPSQHQGVVAIKHGDYIKVAVPPIEELSVVPTEYAARCLRLDRSMTAAQIQSHYELHLDTDDELPFVPPLNTICEFVQPNEAFEILPPFLLQVELTLHEVLIPKNKLHKLWQEDSVLDYGGDRFITCLTWFLDSSTHRRCDQPRPVRLSSQLQSWPLTIRSAWSDLIVQQHQCDIHFVQPDVHRAEDEAHIAGHFIVTQSVDLHEVATLFTTVRVRGATDVAQHFAGLAPAVIDVSLCYQLLGIGNLVSRSNPSRNWTIRFGDQQLKDIRQPMQQGRHILFMADDRNVANDGDLVLMQRSAPARVPPQAVDLDFDGELPFFTQMLHLEWRKVAEAPCGEERHAIVHTYYLNPWTMRRCTHARPVALYDDQREWEQTLTDTWFVTSKRGLKLFSIWCPHDHMGPVDLFAAMLF